MAGYCVGLRRGPLRVWPLRSSQKAEGVGGRRKLGIGARERGQKGEQAANPLVPKGIAYVSYHPNRGECPRGETGATCPPIAAPNRPPLPMTPIPVPRQFLR